MQAVDTKREARCRLPPVSASRRTSGETHADLRRLEAHSAGSLRQPCGRSITSFAHSAVIMNAVFIHSVCGQVGRLPGHTQWYTHNTHARTHARMHTHNCMCTNNLVAIFWTVAECFSEQLRQRSNKMISFEPGYRLCNIT